MDTEYEHWFALITNASKRLSEANTLSLGTLRIIPEFDRKSVSGVANYYVLVDRLCDAYYDSDANHLLSSEAEYTHSLEISAESAFKKPRAVSARTRIDWPARFHCNTKFMKRVWCRVIGIYTDWASHIPEVIELDDKDRTILFLERSVPVTELQVAYKAVQFNSPGIPMSGGAYFPFNAEEQKLVDANIMPYLHRLVNFLHTEIVIPVRELGLTEKEYVVMKLILFFSASSVISPKGKEIINRSRRFYRNILCKTVQEEFPHYEIDETLQRVAAIMDLLPRIEQARTIEDEDFSVMTIFNIGDMKGILPCGIFGGSGDELDTRERASVGCTREKGLMRVHPRKGPHEGAPAKRAS
uniref:NR LBD domain-containing protein n=1 Tax=Panagrellus redivivus TaxID=6233 RepID=A0A7E4V0U3_PANRE